MKRYDIFQYNNVIKQKLFRKLCPFGVYPGNNDLFWLSNKMELVFKFVRFEL